MIMHPDISIINGRERHREMLAVADRWRLAGQARDMARAASCARRLAGHDSGVRALQRLTRVLLKGGR
jgi:hypothetical protein